MEAHDALSPLCQCDLSEPSMVAARRYSKTPYIPQGMNCSLYLNVGTFSGHVTLMHFPYDRLCLHQLLLIIRSDVLLSQEVGEEGLETYPCLPAFLWDGSEEEHHLSDLITLSVPLLTPPPQLEESTQTEGGWDCHPASTKMEGGQATTHLSNSYRTTPRPELNWNISSPRRHRNWPKGMNAREPNRSRGMQGGGHSCWTQQEQPFRRCSCKWIQWRL